MKKAVVFTFLCFAVGLGAAQAQLKVDFTQTGGLVEAGYQGYFASHEVAATFTAQSFAAFGVTVTVWPTWATGATPQAMQMIDRGGNDGTDTPNLLRDWIGTDNRQAGDPMTLTISGLPPGIYEWVSYHHDPEDQTGIFDVTVNDAAGSAKTTGVDISDTRAGGIVRLADVTRFVTTIVSNGKGDVTLVFDVTSGTTPVANAFFVMNAFDLTVVETDQATLPVPGHQATDVLRDGTILSWTPDEAATAHDVYLSTNYDDIDDGMVGSSAYQGRQDANSFDPGRLEFGATYFWRVDEISGGNKVSKGSIWSFTVEPAGIPLTVEHITATASSSNSIGEGPEKTVDGSGLNADEQHSVDTTDMWLSHAGDPGAAWIQYEFDGFYQLGQMLVWNHNTAVEPLIGLGIKEATVAYSQDGTEWATLAPQEFARATGKPDCEAETVVEFGGVAARYVRITANSNWGGGLLKQYGLSEVRFLVIPVSARNPEPASSATDVDPQSVLSWRPGREAAQHRVYLSTDANAVIDGTALVGTVTEPRFDTEGLLELGRTYHWKVDEVNDLEDPSVWGGEVWSFSTMALLPVDDMESYNDAEDQGTRIYETWLDGWTDAVYGGSQVGYAPDPPFAEQTIVHGGAQSMPFYYDNSAAGYSEASRTFDDPQDWTLYGVKALTLWFHGAADNTAAKLYVKVNGRKVAYDGDADSVLRKPWQMWYVDLSGLAGVNLQKVTELTIGCEGGAGLVFFDDIALSPLDRQLVTPVKPDATGLVAHYAFEGNTSDSTGGPAGTVGGAPTFATGKTGQAIKLNGATDYVMITRALDLPVYSAAVWFRVEGGTGSRDVISIFNDAALHGALLEVTSTGALRFLHRATVGVGGGDINVYNNSKFDDGMWYHAAIVKSADTATLYVNGEQAGSAASTTPFDQTLTKIALGMLKYPIVATDARYLPGQMDEVYLYNRVLSQGEIAWLAGRTTPFDKP